MDETAASLLNPQPISKTNVCVVSKPELKSLSKWEKTKRVCSINLPRAERGCHDESPEGTASHPGLSSSPCIQCRPARIKEIDNRFNKKKQRENKMKEGVEAAHIACRGEAKEHELLLYEKPKKERDKVRRRSHGSGGSERER